jgi:hypothetical protein
MLAYLIDEHDTRGEHERCDVALVVPTPDDQGAWSQVAYEAAQHADGACWIPARRRRARSLRGEASA